MSGHIEGFGSTPSGGDGDERGRTFTSVHAVERPPTLDYYRNSVRKTDLAKARASLADLTRGRTQTALQETFETYEKRNLQIVESQLKKKPVVETRSESSISSPPTPPEDTEVSGKKGKKDEGKRKKLGVFEGVFLRVVSNLFGVMLYLRISWVAGQAGIFGGAGVVALGSLVAIVTTLSTSAICTNGQVKGGGSYYLISRSLGPEFGGAIGIIFSIANSVGAAMYVVGFAETVQTLLRNYDVQIVDGGLNDIRIMAACVPLICVVFLGTNFESKMQMVLVALFLSSIVDYWVGTFLWGLILPVDSEKALRGITGYSGTTFNDNLYPNFRDGYNFFTVFAVYFPATTDIMAGANVSGDLEDPQRAIPLGTLSAIVFCSIVYLIMILMTGGTVLRDADGFSMPELHNATLRNQLSPTCADNSTCPYGLMNYFQIVELGSGWGPLVTAGIFACTLSSALVSMVSAPKIFQAVCRDKLFPYIDYFATGYGKNDEPRKGYFLTLAIVCAVILIGDLNVIAPVISNFFLCGYALTNFACFDNSFADSPGFRPSFKYYNKWVALGGSLLCIAIMFIVSWVTALITIVFFGALFLFILHRKPDANWGTSLQAHHYNSAISSVIGLERTDEHVKNYHPQVLVLTGNPVSRSSLVDFVYSITKGQSLMVCGNVIKYSPTKSVVELMKRLEEDVRQWFKERHTRVFYNAQANPDFRKGAQSLFLGSASGLGKLRPNILVLGFKNDWVEVAEKNLPEVNEYFGVIRDAFDNNMAVAILRNGNRGLDFSELLYQHNDDTFVKCNYKKRDSTFSLKRASIFGKGAAPKIGDSSLAGYNVVNMDHRGYESDETVAVTGFKRRSDSSLASIATVDGTLEGRYHKSYANLSAQQRILLGDMNRFHTRVKKATIDVWWLYDDGGLTLLVSYLLAQPRSYLENASLRVFALSTKSESELEEERTDIETLLTKFRINFSQLTIVPHESKKPQPEIVGEFDKLIAPFRYDPTEGSREGMVSESELQSQREQTWHHLRTADLLRRNSSDSNLIVLTLPVPRKGLVSSTLYLSWLEMLSRDLPPVFFVRGNQENVLTFYL